MLSTLEKLKNPLYLIGTVNFLGAVAIVLGARMSHPVYLFGVLLTLPGSVISGLAVNSLQHQRFSVHWNCCGTNSSSLIDVMYLPLALLVNLILTFVVLLVYHSVRGDGQRA